MVEIEKTIYPRFYKNKKLSNKDLQTMYTPTEDEVLLAEKYTKDSINKLKFLILLKSFQKLGYFVSTVTVQVNIVMVKHRHKLLKTQHILQMKKTLVVY